MTNKKTQHINARLNIENYLLVKDIADTLFKDSMDLPEEPGNFSKALNYIIQTFAEDQKIGMILKTIRAHAEFQRGVRTKEVIEGEHAFQRLLESNISP